MSSPIPAVYKSLVRTMSDFIAQLNASSLHPQMSYHNWENRGDEDKLPRTTLIGLDGFSFDENGGLWVIRYALAVSSYRDANLLNEIELIGAIHSRFGQGQKVSLLSMIDASVENELIVSEFKVLPMAQSEIRNYRTIGMELLRTGS